MLSALKVVDNAHHEVGAENFALMMQEEFGKLFKTPILHSQILLPR
jgi:hypothetical protein